MPVLRDKDADTAAALRQVLHLSFVTGSKLVDKAGETIGKVDDLIVRLGGAGFPPITGLMATVAQRPSFIPIGQVESIRHGRVQLGSSRLDLRRFARRPDEVLLRRDMLDRQLINVEGARLVRANEIEIARIGNTYRAIGVDTSARGFLRRLLPRFLAVRVDVEQFLSWEHVEPFVGHVPTVRLSIPHPKLAQLHPAQIADLVEAASHGEGEEIIEAVRGSDAELEADVFEELDAQHQKEFLDDRSNEQVAEVIARMETDDAAHILSDLPLARRDDVFALLPWDRRRKVRALLGHDPATAGGLMSSDHLAVRSDNTVADALAKVKASTAPDELRAMVFVVGADQRLAGALSLPVLVAAEADTAVADLVESRQVPSVPLDTDIDDVARLMADYDLIAIPVVDAAERLVGVVTVDDVLEVVLPTRWRRRFAIIGGE